MTNIIPFPSKARSESQLSVLLWQSRGSFHVTVFDHGHERETGTFPSYGEAHACATSWRMSGATVEDRVGGAA